MSRPRGAGGPSGRPPTTFAERLSARLSEARAGISRLRRPETLVEVVSIAALLGGALMVLAEFLTLFEIQSRGLVVKQQAGGPHHAYAMLVVGCATIAAALLARSTDQWLPAGGVAALGLFGLAFALLGDLPDATRSDLVRGARIGDADPAIGLWVEICGALLALAGGAVLARLLRRGGRGRARRR